MSLTQPDNSLKPYGDTWALNSSLLFLFPVDVPAKLARYSTTEESLYMLTLYYQCNGPILLMWGWGTKTRHRPPSHDILWNYAGSVAGGFEKFITIFPT